MQLLLGMGADVDWADRDGYSALHWACFKGRIATAQALLHAHADANAVSREEGNTAMHYAAFRCGQVQLQLSRVARACDERAYVVCAHA
jgi:ankyrin repeat protein